MDIFAIEWSDERAVQTVDDAAGLPVADVFDVLDGVGLRHVRRVARQHLLEHASATLNLLGETDELVEKLLLSGDEAERHALLGVCRHRSRSRYIAVTTIPDVVDPREDS